MQKTDRQDVYTRITGQIVADFEKGVRPWVKQWNAEHAADRITRPLRHTASLTAESTIFRFGCQPPRRISRRRLRPVPRAELAAELSVYLRTGFSFAPYPQRGWEARNVSPTRV